MSDCVRAIYGKIANSATWGLAAMQKLPTSGIKSDQLSEEEKRQAVKYLINGFCTELILMRQF